MSRWVDAESQMTTRFFMLTQLSQLAGEITIFKNIFPHSI